MLQALEREPEEAPSRTLVTSTEVSESPDDRVSHGQIQSFKILPEIQFTSTHYTRKGSQA